MPGVKPSVKREKMVSITQREFDELRDKRDRQKQKNFSMIEKFPGKSDVKEHFLYKIIFELRPAVCKEYYNLVLRRDFELNEVEIFTKDMTTVARTTYNEKLRNLIEANLIIRKSRYVVMINPYHWRTSKQEVAEFKWSELKDHQQARKKRAAA
jgi:hypothetical protein